MEQELLKSMNVLEEKLSVLASKVYFYKNENSALHKHIALLEKENANLKNNRNHTVSRLKALMQKFDEAGY